MPSRNVIKIYVEQGYYHIYNRGVDKRAIFIDDQDCHIFLHYLKMYLIPKEEVIALSQIDKRSIHFLKYNLSAEIDLLTFALMPNHFHLLIKQHTNDGMSKLMKRLMTAYVTYFNRKYKRRGPLFESVYKACNIDNDSYLLHLSRYIHLNPIHISSEINFLNLSSYPYYMGKLNSSWVKPNEILTYFKDSANSLKLSSYKSFVEDYAVDSSLLLGSLTLEDEYL
jgi:putative transposase